MATATGARDVADEQRKPWRERQHALHVFPVANLDDMRDERGALSPDKPNAASDRR